MVVNSAALHFQHDLLLEKMAEELGIEEGEQVDLLHGFNALHECRGGISSREEARRKDGVVPLPGEWSEQVRPFLRLEWQVPLL